MGRHLNITIHQPKHIYLIKGMVCTSYNCFLFEVRQQLFVHLLNTLKSIIIHSKKCLMCINLVNLNNWVSIIQKSMGSDICSHKYLHVSRVWLEDTYYIICIGYLCSDKFLQHHMYLYNWPHQMIWKKDSLEELLNIFWLKYMQFIELGKWLNNSTHPVIGR